ncbi:MAG: SLBB domain-containing protein [Candidatus Omnitrophica bacterium]|nr:SLBB domain-containing protein [Candidatus Omnitrophota bacterium]
MRRPYKLLLFAVIAAMFFSSSVQAKDAKGDSDYTIHPNDVLEISVYNEPDLDKMVRVSEVGTVNYPLLGNIKAAGLSVRELEKNISEFLAEDYLVNPQVHVFLKEYGSKVSVLGQVKKPGSFELKGSLTLMEAIALAGDFSETGNPASVKVIRKERGQEKIYEIDTSRITEKGDKSQDLDLLPGDVISVEEYGRISVLGQVNKPGSFILKKDLTVLEAIALAGGFTKIADMDATRVVRQENGKKRVYPVKISAIMKGYKSYDIVLLPGDTIVVPESFF